MQISLEWLTDYIDLSGLTVQQVADTLTGIGLEVEGLTEIKALDEKIIVGQINSIRKHPKADKLNILEVNLGSHIETIVCGASNVREKAFVCVAQIGAKLPGGLEIKEASIREQISKGMILSEKEMGLSENHDGILILDENPVIGKKVNTLLKLPNTVLTLNVTPNRTDCLSYIGVARDLSAKLNKPLKKIDTLISFSAENKKTLPIQIDTQNCARFTTLAIDKIAPIPSPFWMAQRLEASGIRSINSLVDVTNYVMLELGQPIHAYDQRFVKKEIKVCEAKEGDKLITLDGSEALLKAGDLVIYDAEKAIGLAGIMGGQNTEIKDDTQNIYIEAAHFDATQIRKTAKALSKSTEASYRFERGVDIQQVNFASKRVAHLLQKIYQEKGLEISISSQAEDFFPNKFSPLMIALRLRRAQKLLDMPHLNINIMVSHLSALGFKLIDQTAERILVEVPSFRHDIQREVDLIEEVGRLEDFNKIPYKQPIMDITPQKQNTLSDFIEELRSSIAQKSLDEVILFPFTGEDEAKKLRIKPEHPLYPSVRLKNPLNEKMGFMQTTLLGNMLEAVLKNRNRGHKGSRLFQIGRGFFTARSEQKGLLRYTNENSIAFTERAKAEPRPIEKNLIAGIIDQPWSEKSWDEAKISAHFFHGKQILTALFKEWGLNQVSFETLEEDTIPFFHPGMSAVIKIEEQVLGFLGEIHPQTALDFGLELETPIAFELNLEAFYQSRQNKSYGMEEPSKFPKVTRDLAFLVDESISYQKFHDTLLEKNLPELKEIKLFDVYHSKELREGKKSFAFSFTFQAKDKTLTDQVVEKHLQEIITWAGAKLNAQQR